MDEHRNPDGTYNGVAVLSELSGLPQMRIREIAELVKANHARLEACGFHEFVALSGKRKRYQCIHCAGEIDASSYHWHQKGRRHQC